MSKEQWFRQFERELAEGTSYERATEVAREKIKDSALEKADRQRKIERGE